MMFKNNKKGVFELRYMLFIISFFIILNFLTIVTIGQVDVQEKDFSEFVDELTTDSGTIMTTLINTGFSIVSGLLGLLGLDSVLYAMAGMPSFVLIGYITLVNTFVLYLIVLISVYLWREVVPFT